MSTIALLRGISPFGPIFGKELLTTARRKRSYWLRVLYLAALLMFLMMVYAAGRGAYNGQGVAARNQQMAMLGMEFFACFTIFSIFAMGVIGPVLTCTAIGSERLHRTLPVLLMTPISAWQIVAGKLFSRLLVALTLIGLSLPVLALVRLLGGVELEQMIAVVCVAAATALGMASIGLFFSTISNRSYVVILLSYAVMFLCYFFVPFVTMMLMFNGGSGTPKVAVFEILAIFNPFFFAFMVVNGGVMMRGGAVWNPWMVCVAVQLTISAVLLVLSALLVRRIARREGERRGGVPTPDQSPSPVNEGTDERAQTRVAKQRRARAVRSVGDNPIIWHEVRRPVMATRRQGIIGACICAAIILVSYFAIVWNQQHINYYETHTIYAVFFNVFGWLLAAVLGATAIAQEKESDTWTLLLATPVSGSAVIWGKAMGVVRRLMWPALFVIGYFLLFVATGVLSVWALILVAWVIITFNSIWIATGIYLSLRMKKVTTAVILNLLIAVVAFIFVPVTLAMIADFAEAGRLANRVLWYLPYYYITTGMEGMSRWFQDPRFQHTMASHDFYLPNSNAGSGAYYSVSAWDFFAAVFVVGIIHLCVAGLILAHTSRRFNRFVARAPQLSPWKPDRYLAEPFSVPDISKGGS